MLRGDFFLRRLGAAFYCSDRFLLPIEPAFEAIESALRRIYTAVDVVQGRLMTPDPRMRDIKVMAGRLLLGDGVGHHSTLM